MNAHFNINKTTSVFTPLLSAVSTGQPTFKIERPVDDETPADGP